jgi:hypothetical protein
VPTTAVDVTQGDNGGAVLIPVHLPLRHSTNSLCQGAVSLIREEAVGACHEHIGGPVNIEVRCGHSEPASVRG